MKIALLGVLLISVCAVLITVAYKCGKKKAVTDAQPRPMEVGYV